jgi:glycosyltransferase involved in cell wall biosynthesis
MSKAKISVVVLTKNSEGEIRSCLESLKFADEIIVIDDYSNDGTPEICKKYTAKIIQSDVEGFANKRNLGTDNAAGDWILQLDADEVVTPALAGAISKAVNSSSAYAGIKFRRKNYFLGHFMRYGGWYHYSANLFKKGFGRYEGLVHERLKLNGPQGIIEEATEHRPFKSISQFIRRQNVYTAYEARDILAEKGALPERHVIYNLKIKPIKLFWKFYVKKQGFREGMYGLVFSLLSSFLHFLKWAKYWELTYGKKTA